MSRVKDSEGEDSDDYDFALLNARADAVYGGSPEPDGPQAAPVAE